MFLLGAQTTSESIMTVPQTLAGPCFLPQPFHEELLRVRVGFQSSGILTAFPREQSLLAMGSFVPDSPENTV